MAKTVPKTVARTVLVTGGAGYIGSHVVRQLTENGYRVVVVDDLSRGFAQAVPTAELVVGSVGDRGLVSRVLQAHRVESVLHFAAHSVVPESIAHPEKYYRNNTANSLSLMECCIEHEVEHFIFSSTAAVYGIPKDGLASEDTPTQPINPYGRSKLMTEHMLEDFSRTGTLRHLSLRYFNVAGCDPEGRLGQSTPDATLLIKVACEVAAGTRDAMYIFGTDYPTPDGTGVRDYIHVEDVADAHIKALDYLERGGQSQILNCGYGRGYSVREVIEALQTEAGKKLNVKEKPRRDGDPPSLIAKADKIRSVLGWRPRYDDLRTMVRDSLAWERAPRY